MRDIMWVVIMVILLVIVLGVAGVGFRSVNLDPAIIIAGLVGFLLGFLVSRISGP